MPKARVRDAIIGGSARDVEAVVYEALQSGDIERLMARRANEDETACVHRSGLRMVDQPAIRATSDEIFASGCICAMPRQVRRVETLVSMVRNELEQIKLAAADGLQVASVLATEVHHKTVQGWRVVVHHVIPGTPAHVSAAQAVTPVRH